VQIVKRRVEVPTPVSLTRRDWRRVLRELTTKLDDGRIYDRDLAGISVELRSLLEAYQRRQRISGALLGLSCALGRSPVVLVRAGGSLGSALPEREGGGGVDRGRTREALEPADDDTEQRSPAVDGTLP
jgi:hypothetical protein